MELLLYIGLFSFSLFLLFWSGSRFIASIIKVAQYLKWREFVVAFFIVSFATSLPNLFVGINAAFRNIPTLSFGDIMGGNVVDLTLVTAIAVLVGKRNLLVESALVQTSALFTLAAVLLPFLLILDGFMSRSDGTILLMAFFVYCSWLFAREERFRKVYNKNTPRGIIGSKVFLLQASKIVFFLLIILLASIGVVKSAEVFAQLFKISLAEVGLFVLGLGNALPEMYFSVISSRKNQGWMVLGNLMGSVIVCSTLILGIISVISPFRIDNFSPFTITRIFIVISILFFLLAIKTGRRITKREGMIFLGLYILFLTTEIIFRRIV